MIKPAYSVSFLLSINIFVWQNVLYFLDAPRTYVLSVCNMVYVAYLATLSISHALSEIIGLKESKFERGLKATLRV